MNTGAFDVQWFTRRLEDKHLSLSKPFRDFIMERLKRHRLGDSGIFETIAELWQWHDSAIEHNRLVAELELPRSYFRSYWEIPPELIDNRPYIFLSFTTYMGLQTEFGILEMTNEEYERYREVLAKKGGNA